MIYKQHGATTSRECAAAQLKSIFLYIDRNDVFAEGARVKITGIPDDRGVVQQTYMLSGAFTVDMTHTHNRLCWKRRNKN